MPARGALVATLALERKIDRIRRRIRLLLAVRWSVRFALGGTLRPVALVIFRLADALPGYHAALLFAGTTPPALRGFCRRDPFQAALATDARPGLKECLSSALALRHDGEQTPLVAALLARPGAARQSTCAPSTCCACRAGALWLVPCSSGAGAYLPTLPRFQSARSGRARRDAGRGRAHRARRHELRQR